MIKVLTAGLAGLLAGGVLWGGGIAPALGASTAKPAITQEASSALSQMGQTLLGNQFSFKARTLRVYADTDGKFLHIGHDLKVLVRRPTGMRVDLDGDDGPSQIFYDGKTVVLYGPAKKEYVSLPAPDTIGGMLEKVVYRMGVDFPLADFLTDAPHETILTGVTTAKVVGTVTIDGVPCLHLMLFQPPGLELELWVEKTAQAVPRRLFITYRSIPGQPTFIAEFSDWDFSVTPTDADFAFNPPEGAKQAEVTPPPQLRVRPAQAKGATQ